MSGTSQSRTETEQWKLAYHEDAQRTRRLNAMPSKLAALGVQDVDRGAAVLDMCCGGGETLITLAAMGFQNLQGIDLYVPPPLLEDPRFSVIIGDAVHTGLRTETFELITSIHSLHHFASADAVAAFLGECHRLLRKGGRLAIVDFPASLQIRLAFWCFRRNFWLFSDYLRYFGKLIQEEWSFLDGYLRQWSEVHRLLHDKRWRMVSEKRGVFYFYLALEKL